jgi:hypothetical protein
MSFFWEKNVCILSISNFSGSPFTMYCASSNTALYFFYPPKVSSSIGINNDAYSSLSSNSSQTSSWFDPIASSLHWQRAETKLINLSFFWESEQIFTIFSITYILICLSSNCLLLVNISDTVNSLIKLFLSLVIIL